MAVMKANAARDVKWQMATMAREASRALGQSGPVPESRLDELLTARGIRAVDLSSATGVDQSTLSKLRRGERRMATHWAHRFAPILGVPPGALFETIGAPIPDTMGGHSPRPEAGSSPARGYGWRIRLIRESLGFTLDQMAARIGLAAQELRDLEAEIGPLSLAVIVSLKAAEGIAADWLLYGETSALSGRVLDKLARARLTMRDAPEASFDKMVRRRARAARLAVWGSDLAGAAAAIGENPQGILAYEHGEGSAPADLLDRISAGTRMPIGWFVTGDFSLLTPMEAARVGAVDPGLVLEGTRGSAAETAEAGRENSAHSS
jgi:transcriptional regulator with XRE-family HTH domain